MHLNFHMLQMQKLKPELQYFSGYTSIGGLNIVSCIEEANIFMVLSRWWPMLLWTKDQLNKNRTWKLFTNLITDGTSITSFHPPENTSQVKMMITFCEEFWILYFIFCREREKVKIYFFKFKHKLTRVYISSWKRATDSNHLQDRWDKHPPHPVEMKREVQWTS